MVNEPVELSYDACEELLRSGSVGRVAVCTPTGPRIIPVNYTVLDEAILFRTSPHGLLGTHAWSSPLAFEVDELDERAQRGWSVVATGHGSSVQESSEMAAIESLRPMWNPQPWAGGERPLLVRLRWDSLTGRRLGGG